MILFHYLLINANFSAPSEQPTIASQVIIQSELEKLMNKQVRKEEKKLQKVINKLEKEGSDDSEDEFIPTELRLKRQQALMAKATPLFNKARTSTQVVQERYPYVFDSKLEAKSSASMLDSLQFYVCR